MSILGTVAATAAAVCAGATGGVYFAFSTMVMPALHARPAPEAIHAMQRINVMAVRLPFMIVFFGGALASAATAVTAATGGAPAEQAPLRLAGAVLSLASVAVTIAANVPRNNALARLTAETGGTEAWRTFEQTWNRANYTRCALSITGAAALTASLTR